MKISPAPFRGLLFSRAEQRSQRDWRRELAEMAIGS
jgi:hypothetical protein